MSTSGDTTFNQTCTEIIKDALIMVGAIEDEATPSAEQYSYARRALNRMVKAWSKRGLKAWKWEEAELQLVPGINQYFIGPGGDLVIPRPLEISTPRRVIDDDDESEVEIRLESRSVFMNQPSKLSEGKTVFVYYDPQLVKGELWTWPTPDDMDMLRFSYKSAIEDFDSLDDDPEFPSEWLEAIIYGLAVRLIPKYEVRGEDAARLTAMASDFLNDAEVNDSDTGSIIFQPEYYC